jgi:hypothetical protein
MDTSYASAFYWLQMEFFGKSVTFMLVGYTRDDIDTFFGRWRTKLKKNDYAMLPWSYSRLCMLRLSM